MPKILQRVGTIKILNVMKYYKKATLVAKNARSGSYAAGCPVNERGGYFSCRDCDRAE